MLISELFEALLSGSYIGMKLSDRTIEYIKQLQTDLGLKDPVTEDDMHITMMYSKVKKVPNGFIPSPKKIVYTGKARLDLYGKEQDTLVLVLEDKSALHTRHNELVAYGLEHSFSDFSPHITLSYKAAGMEISSLPMVNLDNIRLEFVSEYENAIIPDWGKDK